MKSNLRSAFALCLLVLAAVALADDPNRLPTKCETCKYVANEIGESLMKHNSPGYIETGYNIDERLNKKPKKYRDSEVRFIDVMETVCENILSYNVHAERSGSLRYSKGESQTMRSLKELRNRGVKVDLGIPDESWDTPSAEITQLKKYCEELVELYEDNIEEWYKNERDRTSLTDFLCKDIVLKNGDTSCLTEVFTAAENDDKKSTTTTTKKTSEAADEL